MTSPNRKVDFGAVQKYLLLILKQTTRTVKTELLKATKNILQIRDISIPISSNGNSALRNKIISFDW